MLSKKVIAEADSAENFPFKSSFWKGHEALFKRLKVPAHHLLLHEGEFANKLFLIESGCIRAWFNANGKDVTLQFFWENGVVASLESFAKNVPSVVNLETLEPCVVWWIDKEDYGVILEKIKAERGLLDAFLNFILERTYDYMKHFLSSIKDTPEQRYLALVEEKPALIARIPQHYIASYLGITAVHLSRIRGKLARQHSGSRI